MRRADLEKILQLGIDLPFISTHVLNQQIIQRFRWKFKSSAEK